MSKKAGKTYAAKTVQTKRRKRTVILCANERFWFV